MALQRVVGQGFGGAGGGDLPGGVPLVVAVADLALVGQGDLGQAAFVVGVALLAAVRVGVACQLAIHVEALSDGEGQGSGSGPCCHFAVGDGALRGAALRVFGVGERCAILCYQITLT